MIVREGKKETTLSRTSTCGQRAVIMLNPGLASAARVRGARKILRC